MHYNGAARCSHHFVRISLLYIIMIKKLYGELGPYKGSNGKTATIGGSFEYTGAPYYAALSSLKAVVYI